MASCILHESALCGSATKNAHHENINPEEAGGPSHVETLSTGQFRYRLCPMHAARGETADHNDPIEAEVG